MSVRFPDARLKSKWAKGHIRHLNAALHTFLQKNPYTFREYEELYTGDRVFQSAIKSDIDSEIPLILGDALHNMRSALDYVVQGLITERVDAGLIPAVADDQQFRIGLPVLRNAPTAGHVYPALVNRKVQLAGQASVQYFMSLEAYPGGKGNAIWQLDTLNNIDKHRLIIPVAHVIVESAIYQTPRLIAPWLASTMAFARKTKRPVPLKDGAEVYRIKNGPSKMDMHVDLVPDIAFNEPQVIERQSVREAIQSLADVVDAILDEIDATLPNPVP